MREVTLGGRDRLDEIDLTEVEDVVGSRSFDRGRAYAQMGRVLKVDPWWNPAIENQAIDRTHRIGQTRQAMYRMSGLTGRRHPRALLLVGRRRRVLVLVAVGLLALAGCGRAQAVADTRQALEQAGYRAVDISLRAGAGIGVARVSAAGAGMPPDVAAEVAWSTLPVRFDQLVVAIGGESTSFSYNDLERRFGPRDPSLDGRQVDDEVVRSGLRLMLLLTGAAILSVGVVVALGLAVVRAAKRARAGG